ncbi:hypothetical protein Peur_037537 [Populus x canadensis]|jgi:hypothetical protein
MLLTVMEDANNSFWQASHPLNYWLYFGVFYDVLSSMVLTVWQIMDDFQIESLKKYFFISKRRGLRFLLVICR